MGEGEDEGSDGRQWNEMEQNGTELKVSSLLATRDEANQGRLAHRVRVSGVPNEATVAPFSASLLGVNEANQGQMGPGINPPPSFPRRREPRIPGPSDPLALWERVRVRVRGRECNEMQSNATELKVSPLLATPDEANQGHNQGRLAHRIRVSGVPNEATVALFSASPLGVNEAKQGQIGPGVNPLPSFLCPHLQER